MAQYTDSILAPLSLARCRYSMDVITDGSAFTGHGTLIFSVLRGSSYGTNQPEEDEIMRRYSFGYCENMGRLAQDQKQKLAQITAVFLPMVDVASTAGIPSLLLTLSDAGAEQVSIVGPPPLAKYLNFTANFILKNRLYPKVNVCEVPVAFNEQDASKKRDCDGDKKTKSDQSSSWWRVYQDELVEVFARSYVVANIPASTSCNVNNKISHTNGGSVRDSPEESSLHPQMCNKRKGKTVVVAYLLTIRGSSNCTFSFTVSPKGAPLFPLPESILSSSPVPLNFLLYWSGGFTLNSSFVACPSSANFVFEIDKASKICSVTQNDKDTCKYHHNIEEWDEGILRIATTSAQKFHKVLPSFFPKSRAIQMVDEELFDLSRNCNRNIETFTKSDRDVLFLRTGDSIRFNLLDLPTARPQIVSFPYRPAKKFNNKVPLLTSKATTNASAAFSKHCKPEDYHQDENEIQLDDEDHDDDNSSITTIAGIPDIDFAYPYLLVLGTGCAAPSALRGSSAYALFLPFCNPGVSTSTNNTLSLFALIDCGEGCLTSLAQYIPQSLCLNQSLLSLKLIWISHAHLDHYGGLATIIKAIDDARISREKSNTLSFIEKPIVIAPLVVLQYLDECLGCVNGIVVSSVNQEGGSVSYRLFYAATHNDFQRNSTNNYGNAVQDMLYAYEVIHCKTQRSWKPVGALKSIPVEHCSHAYALIIDVRYLDYECGDIMTFCLCYSGDCRPSNNLVLACTRHHRIPDLIIHEATFDDTMRKDAIIKRHCTVSEAFEVVKKIGAKSCLLSHFSQRYPRTSDNNLSSNSSIDVSSNNLRSSLNFCSAVDGLLIPLTETFLKSLSLLDRAIVSFVNLSDYPKRKS